MLVAAARVAPKYVVKGGEERREALRKAVMTDVKKAMGVTVNDVPFALLRFSVRSRSFPDLFILL